ncbi:Protein of unknown function [Bacillus mycoides]|nr:Protein of unknown function [Bacillus mycoides]
MKEFVKKKGE